MVVVLPGPRPAVAGFGDCRVLILDPVVANRRLLRDMFAMMEVGEVGCCGEPGEVWCALAEGRWDALFLDWSSRSDAMEVLASLRTSHHPQRFLPVVVMSGFHGSDAANRARDAGASEYMLKPFSLDVVRSRLRAAVLQPRLFVDSPGFFGPDRRRRRLPIAVDAERRCHENWLGEERRCREQSSAGRERRHSRTGYVPIERRGAPRR